MCEATTIAAIGVAVSIAATAASTYVAVEQANTQETYQNRLAEARNKEMEENYKLAAESARQQYRDIQNRTTQEQEAKFQEERLSTREAAKARATARTAAGEAGVSGVNLDSLLGEFFAQEAEYRTALNTNLEYTTEALDSEGKVVEAGAKGRIAAVRPYVKEPVTRPNYLASALQIGGDALSTYNRYRAPRSTGSGYPTGAYNHGAYGSAF